MNKFKWGKLKAGECDIFLPCGDFFWILWARKSLVFIATFFRDCFLRESHAVDFEQELATVRMQGRKMLILSTNQTKNGAAASTANNKHLMERKSNNNTAVCFYFQRLATSISQFASYTQGAIKNVTFSFFQMIGPDQKWNRIKSVKLHDTKRNLSRFSISLQNKCWLIHNSKVKISFCPVLSI